MRHRLATLIVCDACNCCSSLAWLWVSLRGRPPSRPRKRAASMPALVRSRIRSRSNWATPANTVKTNTPPGVVVSRCSVRLLNCTPRLARSLTRPIRCCVLRPSRSRRHTVSTSPVRNVSIILASSGRSSLTPLAVSVYIRSHPAFRSASICKSRF